MEETMAAEAFKAGAPAPDGSQEVPPGGADAPSNSALYVGDLDKDLNETDLYDLFNEAGPVHSIRVCRDTVTRRSLGYAYVNYNVGVDPDAAKNAMEKLNYREVKGKPIRIMWANRGVAERRKEGNIFIKNLEKDITTRLLHDTFSSFGKILSCKVALDQENQSKGYGFVQFEDPDAAQLAIDGVNGMTLGDQSDKVVTVTSFLARSERGETSRRFTNLYVKNLPETIETEEDLKKMFAEYGTISSAVLTTNKSIGKPFGFVNFDTPEAAAAAKAALHDTVLDGSQLYVDRAQSKIERSELLRTRQEIKRTEQQEAMEGRNVYVKNLPEQFDEDALRQLFKSFGEIESVKIMRDTESKASRGFGFVLFKGPESAQAAVQSLHAQPLPSVAGEPSNGKLLYVAFAQSKALRAQQLENMAKVKAMQGGGPLGGQGRGMGGPMPGMPGMPNGMGGFVAGGYPGMMPFAANGRGMMPMSPMYPGMMANGRVMGGQNGSRGGGPAGMMPMNPAMMGPMGPNMMPMGPNMMGMANGMGGRGGGRGAGRGGRGAAGGRGAMNTGRGMGGARGMGPRSGMPGGPGGMMQRGPMGPGGMGPGGGMGPAAPEEAPVEVSLTNKLRTMSEDDQKQHLGELLFPKIQGMLLQRYSPDNSEKLASKVTGMFLEMDTSGLLYLLDTDSECHDKINEALEVLRTHGAMPEGCA